MKLRRVHPEGTVETLDASTDAGLAQLEAWYRPPRTPWLRLNLVTSVTGSAAGSDGTSDTLTNPVDRTLLKVIRGLADVVLVGAASVRAEGYRMPARAALAVVTASGDLAGHRITPRPGARLLVVAPPSAGPRAAAALADLDPEIVPIEPASDGRLDPHAILAALHERGLVSVVAEGGPQLAGQLLDAGVVDEFCLTTGPLVTGSQPPVLPAGTRARDADLSQLLMDETSGLYARWRVGAPATG